MNLVLLVGALLVAAAIGLYVYRKRNPTVKINFPATGNVTVDTIGDKVEIILEKGADIVEEVVEVAEVAAPVVKKAVKRTAKKVTKKPE